MPPSTPSSWTGSFVLSESIPAQNQSRRLPPSALPTLLPHPTCLPLLPPKHAPMEGLRKVGEKIEDVAGLPHHPHPRQPAAAAAPAGEPDWATHDHYPGVCCHASTLSIHRKLGTLAHACLEALPAVQGPRLPASPASTQTTPPRLPRHEEPAGCMHHTCTCFHGMCWQPRAAKGAPLPPSLNAPQASAAAAPAYAPEGPAATGKHHLDLSKMSPRAQAIM